jgi:hypothetical protein
MSDLRVIETCWRIAAAKNVFVTCAIYRDNLPGFVVQAGVRPDAFVDTARAPDIVAARVVAEQWRQVWLTKGFAES